LLLFALAPFTGSSQTVLSNLKLMHTAAGPFYGPVSWKSLPGNRYVGSKVTQLSSHGLVPSTIRYSISVKTSGKVDEVQIEGFCASPSDLNAIASSVQMVTKVWSSNTGVAAPAGLSIALKTGHSFHAISAGLIFDLRIVDVTMRRAS
jgi:hypothetical protein